MEIFVHQQLPRQINDKGPIESRNYDDYRHIHDHRCDSSPTDIDRVSAVEYSNVDASYFLLIQSQDIVLLNTYIFSRTHIS